MRLREIATTIAVCLMLSMAMLGAQTQTRRNDLIATLERGGVVFGGGAGDCASRDAAIAVEQDKQMDYVVCLNEHTPFDMDHLRVFLQFTLNPAAILERGRLGTEHPVLYQIPAYGREMNQWMVKHVLGQGAYGIMFPHIETVEQALNAVKVMRYPQGKGVPDYEPVGLRGITPTMNAPRYWGLSLDEYREKADVWPLDPNGELVNMLQIENELGVKNVREIAQVKGITSLFVAQNDIRTSYGGDEVKTEEGVQAILAACKEFKVICGIAASASDIELRIKQGFRWFVASGAALTIGRKAAGRTR